jgi:hypothetical protein
MERKFAVDPVGCEGCPHKGRCGDDMIYEGPGLPIIPAERQAYLDPIGNMLKKMKEEKRAEEPPKPTRVEIVFPVSNRTPEEEIERTKKLLKPEKTGMPLTVGDLSAFTARKKEADRRWAQNSVNQDPRMTVGDLTPAHDQGKGLDELFVGRPAHRFPTTESQKLLEEKYENDAKKADVRFRVQNPSIKEKALDALELIPKIKATLAEAEREREEQRKEDAWREVEKQLRAKGITI